MCYILICYESFFLSRDRMNSYVARKYNINIGLDGGRLGKGLADLTDLTLLKQTRLDLTSLTDITCAPSRMCIPGDPPGDSREDPFYQPR